MQTLINQGKEYIIQTAKKFAVADLPAFTDYVQRDHQQIAVIIGGSSVKHSISPLMHTWMAWRQGQDLLYIPWETDLPAQQLLDIFARDTRILGGNATMPYKLDVFEQLQATGDVMHCARLAGACNTFWQQEGKRHARNTDIDGIHDPLLQAKNTLTSGSSALVLGAGGAARAAVIALARLSYDDIIICNRSAPRAETLISYVQERGLWAGDGGELRLSFLPYDPTAHVASIESVFDHPRLIINTLPFGFATDKPLTPLPVELVDRHHSQILGYFDVMYSLAQAATPLVQHIRQHYPHIPCWTGIDMVIAQAKKGYESRLPSTSFDIQAMRQLLLGQ